MKPDHDIPAEALVIREAWRAKRPNKTLTQFIGVLTGRPEWETFVYVASYSTGEMGRHEFVKIVQSKDFTGPHHSPYFVLHSDTELFLARMIIAELGLWDFRTGKRLKKP